MGLLQKAAETYDSHSSLVGVYREGRSGTGIPPGGLHPGAK